MKLLLITQQSEHLIGKFTHLIRNLQGPTFAYQFYNVSRFGFLLLSSVVLARLFPDMVLVTQYEQLLLLGGAFTFFWVSGLYDGFIVLYRGGDETARSEIVGHTFYIGLGWAALSAGLCFWGGQIGLVGGLRADLLLPFSLFLFLDMSSQLLVFYLLVRGTPRSLLGYGFAVFLAYFLLLAVPLWQGQGLEYALWLLVILGACKLLILLLIARGPILGFRPSKSRLRGILSVSLPIALAILLSQSAQYVDSFLVESRFPDQFAVFRYGAKELPIVLLLANAMSLVRAGDISEARENGDPTPALQGLKRSSARLVHSMFAISVLLLTLSHWLFREVFGEAFIDSVPVFDLYLLLVIPRMLFPQSVIRGYLRTTAMTMSAGVELVLNVALSLILMEFWGIAGIAAATVVAFAVEKLILVLWCRIKLGFSPVSYTPMAAWIIWSAVILLAFVLKYLLMDA